MTSQLSQRCRLPARRAQRPCCGKRGGDGPAGPADPARATHTHTHRGISVHASRHTHTHTRTHPALHIQAYIDMCVPVCVCVCVCVPVCVCVHPYLEGPVDDRDGVASAHRVLMAVVCSGGPRVPLRQHLCQTHGAHGAALVQHAEGVRVHPYNHPNRRTAADPPPQSYTRQ
jgi:hypothetical protein